MKSSQLSLHDMILQIRYLVKFDPIVKESQGEISYLRCSKKLQFTDLCKR